MQRFLDSIRSFFSPARNLSPEQLQEIFRQRYRNFRNLLTANNNALELMAAMEERRDSGRPFGMAFVRGGCTALTANVYKMIKNLVELADGRYATLDGRFNAIAGRIDRTLGSRQHPAESDQPHILHFDEIDLGSIDQTGEKMAALGEIRNRLAIATPPGFVITAAAARSFMAASGLQDEINRRLKSLDENDLEDLYRVSAAVQKLISGAPLPEELDTRITRAYYRLAAESGGEIPVAMRSSALGEDGMQVSFAGQYRTQLDVHADLLGQTYKDILAGKYRSQAILYRQQRGFRHQDVTMCVGCLAMVDAEVSGILYTRESGERMAVHAVAGLASRAVDGSAPADLYLLCRKPPHDIVHTDVSARRGRDPAGEPMPLLDRGRLAELAGVAMRLEEHFGHPQDIEWSFDRTGKLYILQSRALDDTLLDAAGNTPPPLPAGLPPPLIARGITASRGAACGPVHKVRSSVDLLQFPRDAILVVPSPAPEYAVLVNRAAGIISETGQSAAHLATVAREFGVPALFNAAGACAVLDNGDLVTLDAGGRRVFAGRVEEILAAGRAKPDLMTGSPVHTILKETLRHITPLNLTDPASPFFSPAACQTLHDITRFCHEKAVQEMFDLGGRYGFDHRAAKQLVVDTPFQWWIINLDDGFADGVDPAGHFVDIAQIVSRPMLAIWQGMTALPWQGPPPVSLGGLGSIIFQSTMNPRLDPAVRSGMGGKNYFLISRNFCNLSVRLGYHFALAEANLGEYQTENYVSFQFKGGAADERRRFLRINLLAEILDRFDFRVETVRDTLTARLEKRPAEFLRSRLVALGYLLIHTRQIDMVMADGDSIDRYRRRITADLAKILPETALTEVLQ
ncbi:MAG: PEP/pyruvate-binding domain-containing protein [Thermodesulfobacteriota bacterium]